MSDERKELKCPECSGELLVSPDDDNIADCVGVGRDGGCCSVFDVPMVRRYWDGQRAVAALEWFSRSGHSIVQGHSGWACSHGLYGCKWVEADTPLAAIEAARAAEQEEG